MPIAHARMFPALLIALIATMAAPPAASAESVGEPGTALPGSSETVTIMVRNGSTAITDTLALPASGSPEVAVTPHSGTTSPVFISARSVLALLSAFDAATSTLEITSIQYYPDYGSLIVNCISIPTHGADPACFSWQYAVNGATPMVGADVTELQSGDTAIFYFGYPRDVALSASSVATAESFTATARVYQPATDTYSPASGVTVGVTQPNPADPWTPLEIATSTTDASGNAAFTIAAAGAYDVGIKEDFYFPTTPLTVTESPAPSSNGGGTSGGSAPTASSSGGGGPIAEKPFDVGRAVQFLLSAQNADGSFASPLLTDWAAIALSAAGSASTDALRAFLRTDTGIFPATTDYERRAMALLALDIDPRAGTEFNYIGRLVGDFDGTQMGDASLVNDDIFALFPLIAAGYSDSDPMIRNIIGFILQKQRADGSWERSVDLTAAGIQALAPFPSYVGVPQALLQAENFLRSKQSDAAGFGADSFSVSWVLQAIAARGDSPSNWTRSGSTPLGFLARQQQGDGGLELLSAEKATRAWATAYAIPAALGKTWYAVLGTAHSSQPQTNAQETASTSPEAIAGQEAPVADAASSEISEPEETPHATEPHTPPAWLTIAPPGANAFQQEIMSGASTASAQTAAAATTVPDAGFFSLVWGSVASFLSNIF